MRVPKRTHIFTPCGPSLSFRGGRKSEQRRLVSRRLVSVARKGLGGAEICSVRAKIFAVESQIRSILQGEKLGQKSQLEGGKLLCQRFPEVPFHAQ